MLVPKELQFTMSVRNIPPVRRFGTDYRTLPTAYRLFCPLAYCSRPTGLFTGHWSLVTGHYGHWSPVTGYTYFLLLFHTAAIQSLRGREQEVIVGVSGDLRNGSFRLLPVLHVLTKDRNDDMSPFVRKVNNTYVIDCPPDSTRLVGNIHRRRDATHEYGCFPSHI